MTTRHVALAAAALVLTGSLGAAPPSVPIDVDAMLALTDDAAHPAQGPLRALGLAASIPTRLHEAPVMGVAPALLHLYVTIDVTLTPELISAVEEMEAAVPPQQRAILGSLIEATARGNALARAEAPRGELLDAALVMMAAAEDALAAPRSTWDATPRVEDPLGFVVLGSDGDDVYRNFQILSLDPAGNEVYYSNAGGTDTGISPFKAAFAIDLAGNDQYIDCRFFEVSGCWPLHTRFGATRNGIGLAIDAAGDDVRDIYGAMLAAAFAGVAAFLDLGESNDRTLRNPDSALGYAEGGGLALYYDEAGDDYYDAGVAVMGFGINLGVGVFVDGDGVDDSRDTSMATGGTHAFEPICLGISIYLDNGSDGDLYPPYLANNAVWGGIELDCLSTPAIARGEDR